mmetsp:Transcript_7351/g.28938  ORF Transcript_7351/g.28938 Transcript_7351/m.28938 type:complete len:159 (+) Transcript_7351:211-687(+)
MAAASEPLGQLDWNFSQVFGERTPGEEVQDADIISAVEFDKTGEHLATGDRGGRVVLFERIHPSKAALVRAPLTHRRTDNALVPATPLRTRARGKFTPRIRTDRAARRSRIRRATRPGRSARRVAGSPRAARASLATPAPPPSTETRRKNPSHDQTRR